MNVIQLKPRPLEKKEPMQWLCNCGCLSFYVYEDGSMVCALCKTRQTHSALVGSSDLAPMAAGGQPSATTLTKAIPLSGDA